MDFVFLSKQQHTTPMLKYQHGREQDLKQAMPSLLELIRDRRHTL